MIRESGATTAGAEPRPFFDFLEGCLRHKSEAVIFEAARAICNLKDVSTRELTPAITLLQLFLSNNKPVVRFAAVRTLNKVRGHPVALAGVLLCPHKSFAHGIDVWPYCSGTAKPPVK